MLAENIKMIRKNKGYSQEELAEKIHVTRQTVSKWENNARENDIFTVEEDGSHRITGKIYKEPEYMTEIWVLSYGAYDQENRENVNDFMMANAFSPGYDPVGTNTEAKEMLPDGAEFFVAVSDAGVVEDGKRYGGTNYEAYIVLDGNLYRVTVYNGNNAVEDGEFVISSMSIDPTLKEEYRPAG